MYFDDRLCDYFKMASYRYKIDKACPECFAYPWLREYIAAESTTTGICPNCRRRNQPLVSVSNLYDAFDNLISAYQPVEDSWIESGTAILDLIQDDWEVFSEKLIENDRAGSLLEAIMISGWDDDSGDPILGAYDLYVARHNHWTHDTLETIWEQFSYEVKLNPNNELKFHDLPFSEFLIGEIIGTRTIRYPAGTILYRARLGFTVSADGKKPYQKLAIGAPPPEKAGPGRANAKGKVVLYCTNRENTAVAEVRPVRGEYASVAEVHTTKDLDLIDFSGESEWPNPFTDDAVNYSVEFAGLLVGFAEELSKPLRSRDDPTDYIPSQKLVDLIQKERTDGILFPSAMESTGTNVVLFDPSVVQIGPSRLVEIVEMRVEYQDVQLDDD